MFATLATGDGDQRSACATCGRRISKLRRWMLRAATQPQGSVSFSNASSNSATSDCAASAVARYHRSNPRQHSSQRSTRPPPLMALPLVPTTVFRSFSHCLLSFLHPIFCLPSVLPVPFLLWDRRHHQQPQRARRFRPLRARHWSRRRCSQYNLTWAHTRAYAKGASEKTNIPLEREIADAHRTYD
jgi:hypothetical protein